MELSSSSRLGKPLIQYMNYKHVGEGKTRKRIFLGIVLSLLMICSLPSTSHVHEVKAAGAGMGTNQTTLADTINAFTVNASDQQNTLADTLNSLISSDTFPLSTPFLSGGVNELQLGIIFGKYGSSVYDQMAQALLNAGSWLCLIELKRAAEVSGYDSAVLDSAVNQALNNIPMVGSLPGDNGQFWTTEGFLLWGYKYAQQLGVSRWDPRAAFTQLAGIIDQDGGGFRSSSDGMTPASQGNTRYYDEQAETLRDCYILYLEGVTEAKAYCDKLWNHLLNDGWWDSSGGWFWYRPEWQCFECEVGKFASVISWYLGSPPSQVVSDLNQKLLIKGWNSAGWSPGNDVIIHAADPDGSPVNSQMRPAETMMAWRALQDTYPYMNSAEQASMVNMLTGNAWSRALGSGAFSGTADRSPGIMTLFLMGIIPGTASLNTGYDEEFYDDNEISFPSNEYRFDYADHTITIPVQGSGKMQFNFGTALASANFPGTGIYNVTFSSDWNAVTKISVVEAATPSPSPPVPNFTWRPALPTIAETVTLDASSSLPGLNGSNTMPIVLYSWDFGDNNTMETSISTVTHAYASAGVYNVTLSVADSEGLANSTSKTLTVYVPVSISPSSVAMCLDQSQLFTSNVLFGTPPYAYQWYLNDTQVSGATNSTWTFTPVSAGSYSVYVSVTDSVGVQATSNNATVTVNIGTYDVAVTNVASSKTVVGQGFSANITVTAANQGSCTETFNVTAYANTTSVASQNVTLPSGTSTNMTLVWNATGFTKGNYTISAYARPVPGETNTADNNFTGGWVIVSLPGDITGPDGWPDGRVDMRDIGAVARHFGATPSLLRWDPNADINGDGRIDIKDIGIVARHFGQHYP